MEQEYSDSEGIPTTYIKWHYFKLFLEMFLERLEKAELIAEEMKVLCDNFAQLKFESIAKSNFESEQNHGFFVELKGEEKGEINQ